MRKLFLVLVLAFSALSVNAVGLKFGIKLGAVVSTVENTNGTADGTDLTQCAYPFTGEPVVTFTGGLAAKIDIYKGFGIDPELMFQQISGEIYRRSVTEISGNDINKYKVTTISIPIMFRYRLDLPVVSPMVFMGPVFGLRLQSGYSYALSPTTVQTDWRVGVGAMILKNTEVAVSYNYGLNNFTDYKDEYVNAITHELHNRATYWAVTLGYYF